MGSCYSGDHIAPDHVVHTNITASNSEEPQQKYCLGKTVSNRLLGSRGGVKLVFLDPNPRPLLLLLFETFGLHEGFPTHQ